MPYVSQAYEVNFVSRQLTLVQNGFERSLPGPPGAKANEAFASSCYLPLVRIKPPPITCWCDEAIKEDCAGLTLKSLMLSFPALTVLIPLLIVGQVLIDVNSHPLLPAAAGAMTKTI